MWPLRKALWSGLSPMVFFIRRPDFAALFTLFWLTVIGKWDLFRNEITLGSDAATQYYPWYYFLGESLRSGSIPAWNPYQFSGTPFAADPLSGWAYLPAMLLFTFLPLGIAVKGFMFLHLLLAGVFTYALGRVLGISIPGAFLAAIAYEYSGFLYLDNTCCFQYIGVIVWLPLTFLGAELAIRSHHWLRRGLWWGISGLALSQILTAWFGQGSYYALLALGGYIAYRTLLSPPESTDGIRERIAGLVLHGGAVLIFGCCLAAAGVLPRLEYNALSNLAGGYPTQGVGLGGWTISDWMLLLKPGFWYAGLIVLVLALVAPLVAGKRFAVPYFGVLGICALILSLKSPTPLHSALYLLPLFERLHPHNPDRVLVVFYLGMALLAGAALSCLKERARRKPLLLVLPVLATLLLATASTMLPSESGGWADLYPLQLQDGTTIPVGLVLFLVLALMLVAAYVLLPAQLRAWRGLAFALLALVVFADLLTADRVVIAGKDFSGPGWRVKMHEVNPVAYYSPSGAAKFLQSKAEEEPFRYFGYDPGLGEAWHLSSPMLFADPNVQALEANGRPMLLGLQNLQGYNPTHIARYDQYMKELNGDEQNYHFMDVFETALGSPLLDLLNARYIIVPAHPSQGNSEGVQRFEQFERVLPTVYEDDQAKVLENPRALPRAWIVHSLQQVSTGQEALKLLSSGKVDPKETALLEDVPPEVSHVEDPSADEVSLTDYGNNRIQLETTTPAPSLLVLSEVYYPAWKAYVDGEPVSVDVADQLLRSVPIPAGEHEVELRYESWTLPVGIGISLVACAVLIVLAMVTGAQHWRKRNCRLLRE